MEYVKETRCSDNHIALLSDTGH